jgi:hypothetical protein
MILQIIGLCIIFIFFIKKETINKKKRRIKFNDNVEKETNNKKKRIRFNDDVEKETNNKKKRIRFNDDVEINIIPNILGICNKDELWYNINDYKSFWKQNKLH